MSTARRARPGDGFVGCKHLQSSGTCTVFPLEEDVTVGHVRADWAIVCQACYVAALDADGQFTFKTDELVVATLEHETPARTPPTRDRAPRAVQRGRLREHSATRGRRRVECDRKARRLGVQVSVVWAAASLVSSWGSFRRRRRAIWRAADLRVTGDLRRAS